MPQHFYFPRCTFHPTFDLSSCFFSSDSFCHSFKPEVPFPVIVITLQFFYFFLSRAQAHVLPSVSPSLQTPPCSCQHFSVMAHEEHSFLSSSVLNMHFATWVPLVQGKSVCSSLLSEGVTSNKQRGICYVFAANKGCESSGLSACSIPNYTLLVPLGSDGWSNCLVYLLLEMSY